MTDAALSAAEPVRCSSWARAAGVDPIGSIGSYSGFVLIELPLPWPRDIGEVPEVVTAMDVVSRCPGLRVQGLVAPRPDGPRRVIAYLRGDGDGYSGSMIRREAAVGDAGVRGAVAEVLEGEAVDAGGGRDLLVCTHGRRDTCCGSLGTELALRLASSGLPAGVRLWRTSHTGGHRFAPTFIVLPEATAWAFADHELVKRVIDRSGDAGEVAGHYRGCAGLDSPRVQALEREVLRQEGWGLLDRRRVGSELAGGTVRLGVHGPGATVDTWSASVEAGRVLPVPDCMRPVEEAKKTETEWVVRGLRRE